MPGLARSGTSATAITAASHALTSRSVFVSLYVCLSLFVWFIFIIVSVVNCILKRILCEASTPGLARSGTSATATTAASHAPTSRFVFVFLYLCLT